MASPVAGGWADLTATLTDAKLPTPPVPDAMRAAMVRYDRWHWGTRAHDRHELYMFGPDLVETFARAEDHVVVSHGGHGVNSYALTYGLVHRGLVLLTQVAWGGVYMDPAAQRAALTTVFADCAALLDEPVEVPPGWRLVYAASDLHFRPTYGWLADDAPIQLPFTSADATAAMAAAHDLLRTGPPR